MATGVIPFSPSVLMRQLSADLINNSCTLNFSENNERHVLFVIGSSAGQSTIYLIKTFSGGTSSFTEIGDAGTGLTLTTGYHTLTISADNTRLDFLDIVINGKLLTV